MNNNQSGSLSVDQKEIKKFEEHSNDWGNRSGAFKILHQINPLRMSYITSTLRKHFSLDRTNFSSLQILDIGCGGGLVTTELGKLGANILGIDASALNISEARIYSQKQEALDNVKYEHCTIEQMLERSQKYDVLICLEVLEHVLNPQNFITNLSKLLRPGGMIIISSINRTIKAFTLGIVAAEYILNWVPKGTHQFSKFTKPSELNSMLEKSNLSIKELQGMSFNLLSQNWELNSDISINYFAYVI